MRWKSLACALVATFTLATAAAADVRLYLIPQIGDGLSPETAHRVKYLGRGETLFGVRFESFDYGVEPFYFVVADVAPAQHTTLSANTDVLSVPANLDTQISALALSTIQGKLEAAKIPADWVTTNLTYRQCAKTIIALMQIQQIFNGTAGAFFGAGGAALDLRINQIPVATRNNLTTAVQVRGISVQGIVGTTLVRTALKMLADQIPSITLLGETF